MSRLPQPGGDTGNWGVILNDYLEQSLNPDGSLRDGSVHEMTIADKSVSERALSDDIVSKLDAPGVKTVNGQSGEVVITKLTLGLQNVDDTSDVNKPISSATQAALDNKLSLTGGTVNGFLQATGTNTSTAINARGAGVYTLFRGSGDGPGGFATQPNFEPSVNISYAYGHINVPKGSPGASSTISNFMGMFSRIDTGNTSGAITSASSIYIAGPSLGTIKPNSIIGIDIAQQSGAQMSSVGMRVQGATTYALQLSNTGGTPSTGITFGTDTNLYRSAADTLRTDDLFVASMGINANGQLISNVSNPAASQDAATKNYVDTSAVTITGTQTITGAKSFTSNLATSAKVYLTNGTFPAAVLSTEVDNQLINFGVNYLQGGSRDSTKRGAYFRIDTREAYATQLFSVTKQEPGTSGNGDEAKVFNLSRNGDIWLSLIHI